MASSSIPNGFVLVPVVPSAAMIAAGSDHSSVSDIWSAMVAAAPEPEVEALAPFRDMRRRLSGPRDCDIPAQTLEVLPTTGANLRNPKFWSDLEVRRLVVETHRQFTVEAAREIIRGQVGAERTPSKSALARAWKRLDLHKKSIRRKSK